MIKVEGRSGRGVELEFKKARFRKEAGFFHRVLEIHLPANNKRIRGHGAVGNVADVDEGDEGFVSHVFSGEAEEVVDLGFETDHGLGGGLRIRLRRGPAGSVRKRRRNGSRDRRGRSRRRFGFCSRGEDILQPDHEDEGEDSASQPELRETVERHFSEKDSEKGGREGKKNEEEKLARVFTGLPHEGVSGDAAGEENGLQNRDGFRFRPAPGIGVDHNGWTADVKRSGDDASNEAK